MAMPSYARVPSMAYVPQQQQTRSYGMPSNAVYVNKGATPSYTQAMPQSYAAPAMTARYAQAPQIYSAPKAVVSGIATDGSTRKAPATYKVSAPSASFSTYGNYQAAGTPSYVIQAGTTQSFAATPTYSTAPSAYQSYPQQGYPSYRSPYTSMPAQTSYMRNVAPQPYPQYISAAASVVAATAKVVKAKVLGTHHQVGQVGAAARAADAAAFDSAAEARAFEAAEKARRATIGEALALAAQAAMGDSREIAEGLAEAATAVNGKAVGLKPVQAGQSLAEKTKEAAINLAEKMTGKDLDGDGDIGLAGHHNQAPVVDHGGAVGRLGRAGFEVQAEPQDQEPVPVLYDAPAPVEQEQELVEEQQYQDQLDAPMELSEGTPVKLQVSLNHAIGLNLQNFSGDQMWCKCKVVHTQQRDAQSECGTQLVVKTLEPVWNETFELEWNVGDALEFTVYDAGPNGDKPEGEATSVTSEQFFPNGLEGDLPIVGLDNAFLNIRVVPLVDAAPGQDAQAQASVKQQIGDWLICEDTQGEFYSHQPTGQTFDQPPPELLQLIEQMQQQ